MSTLIGILLDVSASMRENSKGKINEEGGEWARSILKLLMTCPREWGARTIRKWATPAVIKNTIHIDMIALILEELQSNEKFLENFVYKCLPLSCRDWTREPTEISTENWYIELGVSFLYKCQNGYVNTTTKFYTATEGHVLEVEKKAKSYLLKPVEDVYTVHEASKIVHGYIDEKELTDDRIDELMEIVEPFIYGRTPLYTSIEEATNLFLRDKYKEHKKLLFVLSDGDPTDKGELPRALSKFKNLDITIVTCFITRSNDVTPLTLFCEESPLWDNGAKFLYHLSSIIPTDRLYRSIFVKRGWKIDSFNNETRLFLQDALSDLLVNVSLDRYINKNIKELVSKDQGKDDTCYAFVAATVIHLSINRILKEGDNPDFKTILHDIIERYGTKPASTLLVLKEVCPKYRLQCRHIEIEGALKAITEKRPVVATFGVTGDEHQMFCDFFNENPMGNLSKEDIDITTRDPMIKSSELSGHAVVLTSFNAESLRFMSSWSEKWGDNGFFRVENADVLNMRFIDVFWDSNNLTSDEKAYYKEHGKRKAHEMIEKYIGLQKAEYKCPLCKVISLVNKFIGSIREAICPECKGKFPCDDAGNILAMNIYLTSLSAKPVASKK
ncbi:unnamed protein product [Mytilus edulis]|uniref:VWFA domain-containing protein n=1 Tax=Mytilus edulis TaxID=6550 RepID=A0A8S3VAI3_MYTED|nr:unnamed protein product [Mytilus edulis]